MYPKVMTILGFLAIVTTIAEPNPPSKGSLIIWIGIALMNIWRNKYE